MFTQIFFVDPASTTKHLNVQQEVGGKIRSIMDFHVLSLKIKWKNKDKWGICQCLCLVPLLLRSKYINLFIPDTVTSWRLINRARERWTPGGGHMNRSTECNMTFVYSLNSQWHPALFFTQRHDVLFLGRRLKKTKNILFLWTNILINVGYSTLNSGQKSHYILTFLFNELHITFSYIFYRGGI